MEEDLKKSTSDEDTANRLNTVRQDLLTNLRDINLINELVLKPEEIDLYSNTWEYKEKFENNEYEKIYCPTWDFANYQYRIARSEPGDRNTIELFEVIYYCDIMKEFEFVKQLYLDEDLINKRHLYKTGRSFIIDKETRQIIKAVINI